MVLWILRSLTTRLSRSAATPSAMRAGRHCKDALCLRWISASRLGPDRGPEENFHFLFSILEFRASILDELLFSDFVWCEPASTEQKSGTERGKKNGPALAARHL